MSKYLDAHGLDTLIELVKEDIADSGGGTGGTSNHADLTNLDYDTSGHTGFQKSLSAEQLANIADIPNKVSSDEIPTKLPNPKYLIFRTGENQPTKSYNGETELVVDMFSAVSPTANVTQTATGATIEITDSNGTTTADISNGVNGDDGISPTIAVATNTPTEYTLEITDGFGTFTTPNLKGQDGSGGGSGGGGDSNVYSTTETVVGTWIDGKPIYRKVIDLGLLPEVSSGSLYAVQQQYWVEDRGYYCESFVDMKIIFQTDTVSGRAIVLDSYNWMASIIDPSLTPDEVKLRLSNLQADSRKWYFYYGKEYVDLGYTAKLVFEYTKKDEVI